MQRRQFLASATMNRRGFLGLVAAAAASAGVTLRPWVARADSGAAAEAAASGYRFDVVRVLVRLAAAAGHDHPVLVTGGEEAGDALIGQITAGSSEGSFLAPRRHLAADGTLSVLLTGDRTETLTGWVYMLAEPTTSTPLPSDQTTLRAKSLAYASLSRIDSNRTLSLSTTSHTLTATTDPATGSQPALSLDGEVLAGTTAQTLISGELRVRSVTRSGAQTTVAWTHENANPLQLTIDSAGDRLRYTYTYQVASAIDAAVPVTTAFTLPGGFATFESLRWRSFDRVNSNKPPMFQAETDPGDEPKSMSQYPFLLGRGATGAYVGAIDQAGSSLFGRINEAQNTFGVEMWMWPRTMGQSYTWTFEVTAGYEQYANAFLRAYHPHTITNTSDVSGGVLNPGVFFNSVDEAKQAYAVGVRHTWLHEWFYRNGLYFDSSRPFDETYTAINGMTYSYSDLKSQVEIQQQAGLKSYVYFQFAGVSADVSDQFAASLVRDPSGNAVVAGMDQGIQNLWANPDPDGLYGKSFLKQVDDLLAAIRADGIAMDRGDRLDFTYNTGYDYGSFDGYASPRVPDQTPLPESPTPLPASSITHRGDAFYEQLHAIVEKHGTRLFTNLPTAVPANLNSDMTRIDQPMTPWSLLFMRGSSNGKPFFFLDRTDQTAETDQEKADGNLLVAELSRSHPTLWADSATPYTDMHHDPRLQYIIPTDDPYPSYWLFADGASVIRFDETQTTVPERYAGSAFIPLD